jgi:hypothetical protein
MQSDASSREYSITRQGSQIARTMSKVKSLTCRRQLLHLHPLLHHPETKKPRNEDRKLGPCCQVLEPKPGLEHSHKVTHLSSTLSHTTTEATLRTSDKSEIRMENGKSLVHLLSAVRCSFRRQGQDMSGIVNVNDISWNLSCSS